MIKCRIFAPWFGPLPDHKELFLNSCAKSPMIEWVVHSDQPKPDIPANMIWVQTPSLKTRIQNLFPEFTILNYDWKRKLTDLKPFWHLLFSENFEPVEYRGWCDWDVVHNLSEIPWDFNLAKFTNGKMAGPLILMSYDYPDPIIPANWQRILSSPEPTSWDDMVYLRNAECVRFQSALTFRLDTFTTPINYAFHLGSLKHQPQAIVGFLTKFFPEGLI